MNLKRSSKAFALIFTIYFAMLAPVSACCFLLPWQKDPAINPYVRDFSRLSTPYAASDVQGPIDTPGAETRVGFTGYAENWCGNDTFVQHANIGDVIALNPNTNQLFPGNLISASSFQPSFDGRIVPLQEPSGPRAITVSRITLAAPQVTTEPLYTATMPAATFSNFQTVQQQLIGDQRIVGQPAEYEFSDSIFHSWDQASLQLGFEASYLTDSLKGSLTQNAQQTSNTFIFKFVQLYYAMSTASDTIDPVDAFATSVRADAHFRSLISRDNPAMYIANVNFGRLMLLSVSTNHTENELKAALSAAVQYGLAGASGSLDVASKNVLESSYVHAYILGGNSPSAAQIAAASLGGTASDALIDAITTWLKVGATFDQANAPAAAIAYSVRYLGDGSPFVATYAANWSQQTCAPRNIPVSQVRVTFLTSKDNSKRKQMAAHARLYDSSGRTIVEQYQGTGENWSEGSQYSETDGVKTAMTYDECPSLKLEVGESPQQGHNDTSGLQATVRVDFFYNNQWHTVRNFRDSDEWKWGDASSNSHHLSDTTVLDCPNASS